MGCKAAILNIYPSPGQGETDRGAAMTNVKITCAAMVSVLISALAAEAQPVGSSSPGRNTLSGYVFAGPALDFNDICETLDANRLGCLRPAVRVDTLWHLGAGVDYRFFESFGVLAEVSTIGSRDGGTGILSVNGAYHFRDTPAAGRALVPFVTGGYSLVQGAITNLFNLGGGVDYWTPGSLGLRLETRSYLSEDQRVLDFRVGISVRRR